MWVCVAVLCLQLLTLVLVAVLVGGAAWHAKRLYGVAKQQVVDVVVAASSGLTRGIGQAIAAAAEGRRLPAPAAAAPHQQLQLQHQQHQNQHQQHHQQNQNQHQHHHPPPQQPPAQQAAPVSLLLPQQAAAA